MVFYKKNEANKNSQDKSTSYSGLKSINYSNSRNLSYTLSKNLATLGSGNIEIVDKDNSDDLDRLNKDTTKLTKGIVKTSISSNVDASIDARVFTADGRKQIQKDTQDALTIKDAIAQIITTNRANLLDFFKENGKFYNTLQGVREQIASNPELREALNNPNLNEAQKSVLIQEITNSVMVNLGYLPNETKMIYTDEKGQGGAEVKGFYSLENKYNYINLKNNNTLKDLVTTTGTEAQRAMDTIGGIDITKNRDDNSIYALNFGESLSRYYGYALGDTTTYANAKINNLVNINLNFYNKNNREFARLDKEKGANRSLHSGEKQWIDENVNNFKEFYENQIGNPINNLQAKKTIRTFGKLYGRCR